MKLLFFLLSFLVFVKISSAQDTLLLEGNYTGESLYIQNPAGKDPGSFCTKKVFVNGKELSFEPSSAFEINLKQLNLQSGEKLHVEIIYEAGCRPKVLHPEMHCIPVCNYKILSIGVLGDVITWTSAEQGGKFYYTIEQFRWNKWTKCSDTASVSGSDTATYYFAFKKFLHSGENRFRVKVVDYSTNPVRSSVVTINAPEKKYTMHSRCSGEIIFEQATLWELYDQEGHLQRKGYGNRIDLSGLKHGWYFLNYDNKTAEFAVY